MSVFTIEEMSLINDVFAMMQERINEWADRKGWNHEGKPVSFGDICSLMHSEITEAFEEYRNGRAIDEVWWNEAQALLAASADGLESQGGAYMDKPEGIPMEFADLLIRMLHHFGGRTPHVNLGNCVVLKMDYNDLRPHLHGGKKV